MNHVGVAVDTWKQEADGTWTKTGQRSYHFSTDVSAFCYLNLPLSAVYGKGKVTALNGLYIGKTYITFESHPEEDIEMLKYLDAQVQNPSFYSAFAHQCIFWSVNAVNVGIDKSRARPSEEAFMNKLPDLSDPSNFTPPSE